MRHQAIAVALTLVAILGGCAAPGTPQLVVECGQPPRNPPASGLALVGKEYGVTMSPIPLDSVVFTNKQLSKSVAVQSLHASRTHADNVAVTARVVNCTDKVVQLGMRTSFMDEKQRPTEKISIWKTVLVQPRAIALYQETSIATDDVANYLVEMRDGQ
jgi:hypothetical protein